MQLFAYADHCYDLSGGVFDVTSGSLRALWHVGRETIPSDQEVALALRHVGWPSVSGELAVATTQPKHGHRFRRVVKEYAADTIIEGCLSRGLDQVG